MSSKGYFLQSKYHKWPDMLFFSQWAISLTVDIGIGYFCKAPYYIYIFLVLICYSIEDILISDRKLMKNILTENKNDNKQFYALIFTFLNKDIQLMLVY